MKLHRRRIDDFRQRALGGVGLAGPEVEALFSAPDELVPDLLAAANEVRLKFRGTEIKLCSIVNAKSGKCPEDCAFCSQSAHFETGIKTYPLLPEAEIIKGAKAAGEAGAIEYSIVTSGLGITDRGELDGICRSVKGIREKTGLRTCASLGILEDAALARLRESGLECFHHNLETSRSHFPSVCTTHDYDEDVDAVRRARAAGFRTCCGGIFGMGESTAQRAELVMTLKSLAVDSIPVNFLNPIRGTRLENAMRLTPLECLKIIAAVRLSIPDVDIVVCGGREVNLRDLQSLVFYAGASGLMTGGYLTTPGRDTALDVRMIRDLGLKVAEKNE